MILSLLYAPDPAYRNGAWFESLPFALLSSGVKDILYFYNANTYSGKQKLSGYQAALKEYGLPVVHSLIQFYDGPHEDISAMILRAE